MIDFEDAPDASPPVIKIPRGQVPWELSNESEARPALDPYPVGTPREELPEYLSKLNDPQLEAALTVNGPLIVLAGAGSGKTRMVTSRIAYLVGHLGVSPYQVLAVTFTNKAATEMRDRIEKAIGHVFGSPEVGTFHAICVRILRREAGHTGFTKPFVIYDDSDQLSLVKQVMKKLGIDSKSFNPKSFQGAINRAKCDALEPHEIDPSPLNPFEKHFKRVYGAYQTELLASNALDFGEILCLTYRILRDHQGVREAYQRRFRYIHVDEYQDTNRVQYLLLSMLAGKKSGGHQNICVVGDEDQSIYKWRGADINNILDFDKEYSGTSLVKLEQNYRSSKTIITAASQLISHNTERKVKKLWTDNQDGALIQYVQSGDERQEADVTISEIDKLVLSENYNWDDFAIFYRTHAQSRQFEDSLRKRKIAYQIVGGLRFYDRKEIKDILAYFRVILNPADSVSLRRIINVPARGIGKTTVNKLDTLLNSHPDRYSNLWTVLEEVTRGPGLVKGATLAKLQRFMKIINRLMGEQPKLLLSEFYHILLDEIGYVQDLKKEDTPEAAARVENLEEFDTLLQEFEEEVCDAVSEEFIDEKKPTLLPHFMEQTALVSDVDKKFDPSSVKLMTLHSCKGLEFPVVFVVGMEEGLFPSLRPWEETNDEDIEEERRLCYVGMTRAMKQLYLSSVAVRRIWGQVHYQDPARFLNEIPMDLVNVIDLTRAMSSANSFSSNSNSSQSSKVKSKEFDVSQDYEEIFEESGASVGRKTYHADYGSGTVVASEGNGQSQKLTIEFRIDRKKVRKKFLAKYVSFEE